MTNPQFKVICPKCGDEMNHHADKPGEPLTPEDNKRVDPRLGVIIEEIHGCPACGAVESRRGE